MSDTAPEPTLPAAPPWMRAPIVRRALAPGAGRLAFGLALAQQALLLGTGIAAARLLGPADRGILATAVAVGGAAGGIAALGLEFTGARALRGPVDGLDAARGLLRFRTLVAMVVAPALAIALAAGVAADPLPAAVVGAPLAALVALRTLPTAGLRSAGAAATLAFGRLVQVAAYGAALALLALAGRASAVPVGLAYAAAIGVAAAWLLWEARHTTLRGRWTRPGGAAALADVRAGAHHTLAALVAGDLAMIDILVFGLVAAPAELGVYAACRAFANLASFTAQAASPRLAVAARPPAVPAAIVGAAFVAGLSGYVAAPWLLGPSFAGVAPTAAVCGLAGGAYGLRLVAAEWRRVNVVSRWPLPVESLGLAVLLLPALLGTGSVVLAGAFGLSQAVGALVLGVANRRARPCAS